MGNQPVGHAVSDDVEGQHSRDLGWATNLLGMQFAVCHNQLAAATGRSTPAPPIPPRVPPPQVVGCY